MTYDQKGPIVFFTTTHRQIVKVAIQNSDFRLLWFNPIP